MDFFPRFSSLCNKPYYLKNTYYEIRRVTQHNISKDHQTPLTWNWWLICGNVINIIGSFWMEFKARDRTPSKIIVILLWFSTRCKWRFCKRLWIKLASHKVNKQLLKKAKQIRTVLLVDLAMMVLWLFKQLFVTRCPLLYFAMTLSRDTLSICAAAYCRSAQNRISRMWGADFSPTREWTFLKK